MPEETKREESDERGDRPSGAELPVCPNCMTPGNPCDRFCRECGCPVDPLIEHAVSHTDTPVQRLPAQGSMSKTAAACAGLS